MYQANNTGAEIQIIGTDHSLSRQRKEGQSPSGRKALACAEDEGRHRMEGKM